MTSPGPNLTRISLLVTVSLVLLGALGCGSDGGSDDVDRTTLSEAALVGTWKHDSFADTPDGTRMDVSRDISWTFRANGSATYNQGQSSSDFTWSLDGQNIMFGQVNQYTVVEYSENEMTWRNNQGPTQNYYFVSRQ
jgi:hypothetical protein